MHFGLMKFQVSLDPGCVPRDFAKIFQNIFFRDTTSIATIEQETE